jgi:hypothetical protein
MEGFYRVNEARGRVGGVENQRQRMEEEYERMLEQVIEGMVWRSAQPIVLFQDIPKLPFELCECS